MIKWNLDNLKRRLNKIHSSLFPDPILGFYVSEIKRYHNKIIQSYVSSVSELIKANDTSSSTIKSISELSITPEWTHGKETLLMGLSTSKQIDELCGTVSFYEAVEWEPNILDECEKLLFNGAKELESSNLYKYFFDHTNKLLNWTHELRQIQEFYKKGRALNILFANVLKCKFGTQNPNDYSNQKAMVPVKLDSTFYSRTNHSFPFFLQSFIQELEGFTLKALKLAISFGVKLDSSSFDLILLKNIDKNGTKDSSMKTRLQWSGEKIEVYELIQALWASGKVIDSSTGKKVTKPVLIEAFSDLFNDKYNRLDDSLRESYLAYSHKWRIDKINSAFIDSLRELLEEDKINREKRQNR